MAKKFDELRNKMNPERRTRAEAKAENLLSEAMAINDLRRSLNLTQEHIAKMLEVNQGAISQMEKQDDMYISTLCRIISVMGGKLELVAKFPGRNPVIIDQFEKK